MGAKIQEVATAVIPTPNMNDKLQEVKYYTTWLNQEAEMYDRTSKQKKTDIYTQSAILPVDFHGQQAYPFTPLKPESCAIETVTKGQIFAIFTMGLLWALGLIFFGSQTLVLTVGAITLFYASNIINMFRFAMRTLDLTPEEHIDDDIVRVLYKAPWPIYTILCPLYKEANIVPQFVQAMLAMDYPTDRLQILFLTEVDDEATRRAIQGMHLPSHFDIITVPDGEPRTKPRACNFGLLNTKGEYVVIYDAEDVPDPLQLKKAVLTFANQPPEVACVQAKLSFYNSRQNLLTRWFTLEYLLWFELVLPGMQAGKLSMPLGGTSNHFRTSVLQRLGAWDPFNVTEDCDLGLRLSSLNLKTAMLDSVTYEEANPRIKNWIRQRSRWIKGYLQTYLVHMRRPGRFLNPRKWREFFSLQFMIGGTPATFFINPIMWVLLAVYILFQPYVTDLFHTLYPAPIFYAGAFCLVFGNFLYLYVFMVASTKREEYGLMIWVVLIPIYWVMMSIAAMLAFYQLIFKPHYWEKTHHGLHLNYIQPSVILEQSGVHNPNFKTGRRKRLA